MKITNDRSAFYGILGETIDIYQVEHAAAAAFGKLGGYSSATRERCKVVVGHDASPAADMMTSAVCAALCASGADVVTLGLVPSGAVSYLTCVCEAVMGVMITGGRFDFDVSGLKFYQKDGRQVTGELMQSILAAIDGGFALSGKQSGRIHHADSSVISMYQRNLIDASGFTMFENLKIAVDCTDSAAAPFARYVFEQLGADVSLMDSLLDSQKPRVPSYENPSALINYVRDTESDIGFSFSADGEICIVALPDGRLLDSERLAEVFGRVYGKAYNNEETTPVILVSDNCHIALAPYIKSMGAELKTVTGDYSYLAEEYAADLMLHDFSDIPVAVVHGKTKPDEKERLMADFAANKYSLLVSTTVIEVGVDVPNASVMMIENAERFGLSQLHQLRGRVGRGKFQSYCVLISDSQSPVTAERLRVMCSTNDGFKIADEDLKLRGPGDFFGERQHGLPQMSIADFADTKSLELSQKIADEIMFIYKDLRNDELRLLRAEVERLFARGGENIMN